MTNTIAAARAAKQDASHGEVHRPRPALAALVLGLLAASAARAEETAGPGATAWAPSGHTAARLIAAGPAPGAPGAAEAGIEIRLDPGFITYWRNPGEAGLPPVIDTAGSTNIAAAAVAFPAPRRLDEGGMEAFGYTGRVVLPLRLILADPARPATLAVAVDYAVCATVCLPAAARLRLALPQARQPDEAARLDAASAAVPRPSAVGAPGTPAIVAVRGGPDGYDVTCRATAAAALFVEAPDGWYLRAGPGAPAAAPDQRTFHVAVLQRPEGAPADPALRFTLVDGTAAIEVPAGAEGGAPKP